MSTDVIQGSAHRPATELQSLSSGRGAMPPPGIYSVSTLTVDELVALMRQIIRRQNRRSRRWAPPARRIH
ncbi:MAG: hypothetical protein OSA97_17800 [Nevskia sp.]|nr:hypothetical protein [Nevskia sp.]